MKIISFFVIYILLFSCVIDSNPIAMDTTIVNPDLSKKTILTFQQLYQLHNQPIGKDTVVVGYVASTDVDGNFFKELYVQNTATLEEQEANNPRMGLKIRLGSTHTSLQFSQGRKIAINLEGLKKTTTGDRLVIGAPSGTFIKDIIALDISKHLLKFDEVVTIEPKVISLPEISSKDLNTLVELKNVHFQQAVIGLPLAGLPTDDFSGTRPLEYCTTKSRDTLLVETSNFANFASQIIPLQQVNVRGIYTLSFSRQPVLVLNRFKDLQTIGSSFTCPEITTPNLLLTEIADPKVGAGEKARYVEIYNPTLEEVVLDGWSLVRYNKTATSTNSHAISLNGHTIAAKETLIVANNTQKVKENQTDFESYFGFAPVVINRNLDGNGDDAYVLIDPLNKIKDVYGEPNIDGTGLAWDYENGVAKRKLSSNTATSVFDVSAWEIVTDAPELQASQLPPDFTPGKR